MKELLELGLLEEEENIVVCSMNMDVLGLVFFNL